MKLIRNARLLKWPTKLEEIIFVEWWRIELKGITQFAFDNVSIRSEKGSTGTPTEPCIKVG